MTSFQGACACGRVAFEAPDGVIATIACYCDDCQAVAKHVDALPHGRSGIGADAGTVNTLVRKDRVRCVRGEELLIQHKLRPDSPATRLIASCCNSNMATTFDNWLPLRALRTHALDTTITPEFCIHTRFAPDPSKIIHTAPRHAKIPTGLAMRIAKAAFAVALRRR